MRVVHVVDSLVPGGTERSLAELLPRLRDGGVESIVVSLRRGGRGALGRELRAAGYAVHELGSKSRPVLVARLRRVLRSEAPDVVHTMLFDANIVGRIAARS